MTLSKAELTALFESGASPETILKLAAAKEAEEKQRTREELETKREERDKKRAQAKLRKRRERERTDLAATCDRSPRGVPSLQTSGVPSPNTSAILSDVTLVTRDMRDPPLPLPHTPSPSPPGGGGGGGAPAREASLISEQAFDLANEIFAILGVDREFTPPGWCGTAMWLQAGLNTGWRPELVMLATRKVAASLRDRGAPHPHTFGYLTYPVIREHDNQQRDLPMMRVIATNTEASHGQSARRAHPGGAYGASKDRFREAFAELKAANAERRRTREDVAGERGGGDGASVEFLRPSRRERA